MRRHQFSFFGQKNGMILDSANQEDSFFFLKFLKKLPNGTWEKPSQKEGKNIKFNILEMCEILGTLRNRGHRWGTVHKYNDESTPITFDHVTENLTITIPGYYKTLKGSSELIIFQDLLEHIYNEKIFYATGNNKSIIESDNPPISPNILESYPQNNISTNQSQPFEEFQENQKSLDLLECRDDFCFIKGDILTTRSKAISFKIHEANSIWIPISLVKEDGNSRGGIWIKKWFISKNYSEFFNTGQ